MDNTARSVMQKVTSTIAPSFDFSSNSPDNQNIDSQAQSFGDVLRSIDRPSPTLLDVKAEKNQLANQGSSQAFEVKTSLAKSAFDTQTPANSTDTASADRLPLANGTDQQSQTPISTEVTDSKPPQVSRNNGDTQAQNNRINQEQAETTSQSLAVNTLQTATKPQSQVYQGFIDQVANEKRVGEQLAQPQAMSIQSVSSNGSTLVTNPSVQQGSLSAGEKSDLLDSLNTTNSASALQTGEKLAASTAGQGGVQDTNGDFAKAMIQKIDSIMKNLQMNKAGEVSTKVHLENLGTLNLRVKDMGNFLDVRVMASQNTVQTLNQHIPALVKQLSTASKPAQVQIEVDDEKQETAEFGLAKDQTLQPPKPINLLPASAA